MTATRKPTLSELIERARQALALTQGQLGKKLGVAKRSVAEWEAGLSAPDAVALHRAAGLLAPVDPRLATRLAEASQATPSAPRGEATSGPPPWRLGPDGRVYPRSPGAAPTPSTATERPAALSPAPLRNDAILAVRHLVDSVVCAAAEAGTSTPQAVRPILLAALQRARELHLSASDLEQELRPAD